MSLVSRHRTACPKVLGIEILSNKKMHSIAECIVENVPVVSGPQFDLLLLAYLIYFNLGLGLLIPDLFLFTVLSPRCNQVT